MRKFTHPLGILAAALCLLAPRPNPCHAFDVNQINPEFLMTEEQGQTWNAYKATLGPTYSGSPSHLKFLHFLWTKFQEFGAVDFKKVSWTYDRYFVDDWPHHQGPHALLIGGKSIPVASYTMCSGTTGPQGITRPLMYYDSTRGRPEAGSWKGRIVVVKTRPRPTPPYRTDIGKLPKREQFKFYAASYVLSDYEYLSGPGPFPKLFTQVPPTVNNSFNNRWNFKQQSTFRRWAERGQADAMVVVEDATFGSLKGMLQRTSPFDCPTLVVDKFNGREVVAAAKQGHAASLKLDARYVPSTTYNFVAFLPGRDYGTDRDRIIGIGTHTDAMALTQDNGGLGILGVAEYFSHIPQKDRPRTLMFRIDSRHFMPGGERNWAKYDVFNALPELDGLMRSGRVVVTVGLEHMGELEGREVDADNSMVPTGLPEYTYIGVDDNPWLLNTAVDVARKTGAERVCIKSSNTRKPGIHGQYQSVARVTQAFGRSFFAPGGKGGYGIPGLGQAGNWPGAHTQTFSGMEWFSKRTFHEQVAYWTEMVARLMTVDPLVLDWVWGELNQEIRELPSKAYTNPQTAENLRDMNRAVYDKVVAGDIPSAKRELAQNMRRFATSSIQPEYQRALCAKIDQALTRLAAR